MIRDDDVSRVAGPFYGVRLWDVLFERGMYVLSSDFDPWESGGRASAARCRGGDDGLYAASHPRRPALEYVLQDSLEEIGNPGGCPGVIEAWGRVELDREGFRAELARPRAIFLTRNLAGTDWAEELRRIAANHGAELMRVADEGEALTLLTERSFVLEPDVVTALLDAHGNGTRARLRVARGR